MTQYEESVHGSALTQQGNLDVPTCIDCHGVHNIQSATTASFRNSTPFLCAECHTNNALMRKYGLSTEVLNTYVADFHGTTVVLFDKSLPRPADEQAGLHGLSRRARYCPARTTRIKACRPAKTCWRAASNATQAPRRTSLIRGCRITSHRRRSTRSSITSTCSTSSSFPPCWDPMVLLVVMDFGRAMINRFQEAETCRGGGTCKTEPAIEIGAEDGAGGRAGP
ncbi:MAG: hypothetical protein MZV49_25390 [Rhodopseudomonas palustris]|nr:hypothetical protein [Rhodopseudomonas palustris]